MLSRAALTSDEPEFHIFIEQLQSMFFTSEKLVVLPDGVVQFIALVHADLSVDVFFNDFAVEAEILARRSINAGELVSHADIADIRRLRFPGIAITSTDKVIYCFKTGWRFGLVFDLDRSHKLDLDAFQVSCGALHRYLSFQHVYATIESGPKAQQMLADGWFPFLELLPRDFRRLESAYQADSIQDALVDDIIRSFTTERINAMVGRWWSNAAFADKKPLLQAGVDAFLLDTPSGFIQCIKTLYPEIEGLVRSLYFSETGKGHATTKELLQYVRDKGRIKSGSEVSLLLPTYFFTYLTEVLFAGFDLSTGKVDMSRHSSSHGVAKPADYTKARALQAILALDQIYFYL